MPYTLAKWALWLISAAVTGFVVGWMLRGIRRGSFGSAAAADGGDEMRSLGEYSDDLESLMSERDQLLTQLDKCREQTQFLRRSVAAEVLPSADVFEPSPAHSIGSKAPVVVEPSDAAERYRLAQQVAEQAATIGELRARLWNQEARIGELHDELVAQYAGSAPPEPDLMAGSVVLGEKVRFNDLTVIEGIGPKTADLLLSSGFKSWWQLHQASPDHLRRVLADAGSWFQMLDPTTWPEQAGMLARGEWRQFKLMADRLKGGRLTE